MKTITLNVNGRDMNFSQEELTDIVKGYLKRKALDTEKVAKTPTEDQWFRVIPLAIDPKLFEEKRKDGRQEETRQLILEAFAEMKINPEKYGRNFKTMMPKRTWDIMSPYKLSQLASDLGYNYKMADWVEQCLEWAQRIQNGEAWETLCNKPDTAKWYRAILGKKGNVTIIGGGSIHKNLYANYPTFTGFDSYDTCYAVKCTVPLIVKYDD